MAQGLIALVAAMLVAAGCSSGPEKRFDAPRVLGGVSVSAEVLNRGADVYERNCVPCHGHDGDGRGPQGIHQDPRPRDFREARFKYALVEDGALPNDADLVRTIRTGIPGTLMPPWTLSDAEAHAVVQYVKTFSPRWTRERAGVAIAVPRDPWGRQPAQAVAAGRVLFDAQCVTCHGDRFSSGLMRAGTTTRDIFRVIAVGVHGTRMHGYREAFDARALWALARYVDDARAK